VAQTFEKFKRERRRSTTSTSGVGDEPCRGGDPGSRRAAVPDIFAALDGYCDRHREYLDETIRRFDREVQFYVAYLEHVGRFRPAGLAFCYPALVDRSREIHADRVFDLALARSSFTTTHPWSRTTSPAGAGADPCRVGPNQGGKTTFARTVGQLHHLASIGCPVPGSEATLFLVDGIYSHFEREEDLGNQRGKLEDDLLRIHRILEHATRDSLLVMNESFGSTAVRDAALPEQGGHAGDHRARHDLRVGDVPRRAGIARRDDVSMVSTVDAEDPARRTF